MNDEHEARKLQVLDRLRKGIRPGAPASEAQKKYIHVLLRDKEVPIDIRSHIVADLPTLTRYWADTYITLMKEMEWRRKPGIRFTNSST